MNILRASDQSKGQNVRALILPKQTDKTGGLESGTAKQRNTARVGRGGTVPAPQDLTPMGSQRSLKQAATTESLRKSLCLELQSPQVEFNGKASKPTDEHMPTQK